ncbi:cysteine desulfurase family protein [Christiangramia sp. SM2212]|uniref:cysteine desulfurase n=1 Tax=Christiangramia sediminicola TaxID=3073267 RepID=A0ABU1EQ72_9FLAO|nr:cysteine desulfurase family protein [Christiangramia sp. SM2212]MDR5590511.1 cysteine desulfurase family protein [Christiangramia sp. SM2212]
MASKKKIYLDYNATTPTDSRVVQAMLPYFSETFGNASSDHVFGWDAEEAVENSREQISKLVGCKFSELTFTSGATEAANLALFGFCESNQNKGKHIITCKTEHNAILDTMLALESKGFEVSYLDVNDEGYIDLKDFEATIKSETILVCLMLANNETGLIHPLKNITEIAHSKGVAVMSDITQAVGKIPFNLKDLDIDMAVFSAHKFYGPKGIGALYINKQHKIRVVAHIFGGGQEQGMRPGTLNVPAIVGFGMAAEIASAEMESESVRLNDLKKEMETHLLEIDDAQINSINASRLPNTTNVSFRNIDGSQLLRRLNKLAVSRGSACSANTIKPSHVLKAMGLSDEFALSSLRISLGKDTCQEDIKFAVAEIKSAVNDLKLVKA